jgi:hypothetical protein
LAQSQQKTQIAPKIAENSAQSQKKHNFADGNNLNYLM